MVRVIEPRVKYIEMIWGGRGRGGQKSHQVSGRFPELSKLRVAEGKITVNIRGKSRGFRFWFELAR